MSVNNLTRVVDLVKRAQVTSVDLDELRHLGDYPVWLDFTLGRVQEAIHAACELQRLLNPYVGDSRGQPFFRPW